MKITETFTTAKGDILLPWKKRKKSLITNLKKKKSYNIYTKKYKVK